MSLLLQVVSKSPSGVLLVSATCTTSSGAWACVQMPHSRDLHPQPDASALPVSVGCWSNTHGASPWRWRSEADRSWVSLIWHLKGAQCWPETKPIHLDRGRKLSPWTCSAPFYSYRCCWQPPSLGDLCEVVELKVYLGKDPSTQGSCSDLTPQCAFRWPKGLRGPSASTTGHRHLFPVAFVRIWSFLLESVLKEQLLRKVHLQQWGLSMKVSEKSQGCFTLSHTQSM